MIRVLSILFILISCFFSALGQDFTKPDPPILDSVSVDQSTGNVHISWVLSPSPDVKGYIIYRNKNTIWLAFQDTIMSATTNYYLNLTTNSLHPAEASSHIELYEVAAFDSSMNISLKSAEHNTIYAFPYFNKTDCPSKINISWNSYINWEGGVSQYKIFLSVNNASATLLGVVPGNTTNYLHYNVLPNYSYCYYIEAIGNNGKTSTSNKACCITEMPKSPTYINADYASIEANNEVSLSFTIDPASEVKNFWLLRSKNIAGPFDTIKKFTNVNILTNLTYTDILDTLQSTYYRLIAVDLCGKEIETSNIAHFMILTANGNSAYEHFLEWTNYSNWLGGIERFNVYRYTLNNQPELLSTTTTLNNQYSDNVVEFAMTPIDGNFCYYVEAIEGAGNPYSIVGKSRSNVACVQEKPIVYMPTAFTPGNDLRNDTLQPFISFVCPENYSFSIYNRWGEVFFETKNPQQGWDGKVGGELAPEGIYIYYLKINTPPNNIIKSGCFTLYYPEGYR